MDAKHLPEPAVAITTLKLLTTPSNESSGTLSSDDSAQMFDKMLIVNTQLVENKLSDDPYFKSIADWWKTDQEVRIPTDGCQRWTFVTYCLKSLDCLQKTLTESSDTYNRIKHEPVKASGAPNMSSDTLGIADQKVVRTAIQFVVCLGLCPNLEKGVGIPLERRSGFSKLIGMSKDAADMLEAESRCRLFLCLKVLVSCVFTAALGTMVLTQHVADVLAGLMQLLQGEKLLEGAIVHRTIESRVGCDQRKGNGEGDSKEPVTVGGSVKGENMCQMSPADVVDFVKSKFVGDSKASQTLESSAKVSGIVEDQKTGTNKTNENKLSDATSSVIDTKDDLGSTERVGVYEIQGERVPIQENNIGLEQAASKDDTVTVVDQSEQCSNIRNEIELDQLDEEAALSKDKVDLKFCQKVLGDLLKMVYPPLLVKTLLMLQGAPKSKKPGMMTLPPAPDWLRQACRYHLTSLVMGPHGVQSLLRGMLDRPGATTGMTEAADWRKCDAVAKVIAGCPVQFVSVHNYYRAVAPQVIDLLHIRDEKVQREFLRVVCATISCLYVRQPDLTTDLVLTPLMGPLLACLEITDLSGISEVVVEEQTLTRCVEDLYKVYVCRSAENTGMMGGLRPVVLTLYQLFVFTRSGVSNLKSLCQELIVTYLKQTEPAVTLTCLQTLAFKQTIVGNEADFPRMHPGLCFAHGTNGGVIVALKSMDSDRPTSELPDEGSDDGACLVAILKDIQDTGAAGEFLVYMLKELTIFIQSEIDGSADDDQDQASSDRADEQALLDLEQRNQSRMTQFYRKLTLLNTVATVCEELGPECIKNAHDTLEFVKATLDRGVQVCKVTADVDLGEFETETLTMAMGLLTATLTGAFELTPDDRTYMQELSPLLQEISSNHPESSVQEMATDIRIAIATHGAIWSELTKGKGQDFTELSKKIRAEQNKMDNVSHQTKPKIEVLNSTDHESKPSSSRIPGGTPSHVKHSSSHEKQTCMKNEQSDLSDNTIKITQEKDKKESKAMDTKRSKRLHAENGQLQKNIKETLSDPQNGEKLTLGESIHAGSKDNVTDIVRESKGVITDDPGMAEIDLAFKELLDPLVPVRGHGLIRLTRLVQTRSPAVTLRKEAICKIFQENLDHADSYMYLSSVNGLAAMCDVFPEFVVPTICQQFVDTVIEDQKEAGEGLESSVTGTGGHARSSVTGTGGHARSSVTGTGGHARSPELRMKLGEIMVKASRSLGETIPQYRDQLVSSVLMGARDREPFIRASSLSNLGEICKLLRFSLGNIIQEVFTCCSGLLRSDPDIQVRKAAGQCLTLLLQGLREDSFTVLGSVLRDVYRLLKHSSQTERDEGVLLHVQLALTDMDDIMRGQLFPAQKLEKRIRVLDPE